ncbi:MAG: carboxypeptidase regulatory-like domain-containing protein [Candidatus Hydrogenedentes bacterium]|nr:carboxypeptidase regulatory-like domain-containing protein [Candidatus Hydrogenedentota bacterium]
MNTLIGVLMVALAADGGTAISGIVHDSRDRPIANARVFVEQGLTGPLVSTTTDPDGAFHIEQLGAGVVGIFAIAEGKAFGGKSLNLAPDDRLSDVTIRLRNPATLSGTIQNRRGAAVADARVTRVVLLGNMNVGIPFSKLRAFGFDEPVSDDRGRFSISALPGGVALALKVAHPEYAQEAASGMHAETKDVKVTLHKGVLISGVVVSQSSQKPVSNATIIVRNVQPPYDTVIARTGGQGTFAIRLKPGPYLYQAAGAAYRSHGWKALGVSGDLPVQQVSLQVAGTGAVSAKVMDAKQGVAIHGARVLLRYQGSPAHLARTGPEGAFHMSAAEGEYVLTLDSVPGYRLPKDHALTVHLVSGKTLELPSFWLAPNPKLPVQILDAKGERTGDTLIRLLRPPQLGWQRLPDTGMLDLSRVTVPSDGILVGIVEDPARPQSALFSTSVDREEPAVIHLLPLVSVTGKVVSRSGSALEGHIVEARFVPGDSGDALVLWRTVSRRDGRFVWNGVIPHVPQLCVAYPPGTSVASAANEGSVSFIVDGGESRDIGTIIVSADTKGTSIYGKRFDWTDYPVQCGDFVAEKRRAAVIVFCTPSEVERYANALAMVGEPRAGSSLVAVLVVNGNVDCAAGGIPILRGEAPGTASTYVLDASGTVILETFDVPSANMLVAASTLVAR